MLDTLANVKSRLGITGTTYDTFINSQIQLISDVIEAYCRRKFIEDDYIQTFYRDETPSNKIVDLFHFPVSVVDSIVVDSVAVDPTTYRLNKNTGRVTSTGTPFFGGLETVITYTAGYASCPSPVLAVLDAVVGERYNKHSRGIALDFGSDVQRISIPGAISIDFDYSLSNNERKSAYGTILGSHVNVLDDWRSERAVVGNSKLDYVEVAP